jgi:hypothetical protein
MIQKSKGESAMVDYYPIRSHKHKLPAPEQEADDEAVQDATVDVVVNLYKERRDAHSSALRISFRLPEKG